MLPDRLFGSCRARFERESLSITSAFGMLCSAADRASASAGSARRQLVCSLSGMRRRGGTEEYPVLCLVRQGYAVRERRRCDVELFRARARTQACRARDGRVVLVTCQECPHRGLAGCGADDSARRLGVSRRTLQRRLSDEGTTFQKQLNHARELLAKHYLSAAALDTGEIAYLLGYLELSSFLRASASWRGRSLPEWRKGHAE